MSLADPTQGLVVGNTLIFSMPLTTTVTRQRPSSWQGKAYAWKYTDHNLYDSTLGYNLDVQENRPSADRGSMQNVWQPTSDSDTISATTTVTHGTLLDHPGINQQLPLVLNYGYSLPALECWTVPVPPFWTPVIPVCYDRTLSGGDKSDIGQSIVMDVLPSSLDGFMQLADHGNGGLSLAWDPRFPALPDADNDGLRSVAAGGIDPNDATPDADGDGLPDTFEIGQRQAGQGISPVSPDTDGDGLSDAQEIALGTDPANRDTDGDGTPDGQEVYHQAFSGGRLQRFMAGGWDVPIPGDHGAGPLIYHTSSNPLAPDSDGDGIGDAAERQLATQPVPQPGAPDPRLDSDGNTFNPLVANRSPITVSVTASRAVVRPGATLVYTSTVATTQALTSSVLDVAAPDTLGGQQPPALLAFGPATQTLTQAMVLTAQPGALDQADAITSTVRAFLPDAGPADWNASLEPQSRLGGFTRNAQFTRAAASQPDRPDSYLLSTLTSNAAPSDPIQGSQGDIWLHDARGGGATTVDMDQNDRAILRGGHAPTVACAGGGCMTTW